MVELTKGQKSMSVPSGAVKKFLSSGWKLAITSNKEAISLEGTKSSSGEVDPLNPENQGLSEGEVVADNPDNLTEDENAEEIEYVDPEELALKPIAELDKEELQILAEWKGINPEGMSAKQLRAAIRSLE